MGNFSSKALVQADTDKTTATLSLAKRLAWGDQVNFGAVALTATSPFDSSKADVQDIGSVSGLTAGTNVRLDVTYWHWPRFEQTAEDELDSICAEAIPRIYPGMTWSRVRGAAGSGEWDLAAPPFSISCLVLTNPDNLVSNVTAINRAAQVRAAAEHQPPPATIKAASDANTQARLAYSKVQLAESAGFQATWGLTLSGTANRQNFTFVSSVDPTKSLKQTDTGNGLSLAATVALNSMLISAGASYERTYAGGTQVQICSPIGSTGSTQCASGSLQAPKESTDRLVFLEGRSAIPGWSAVALSPRVEYNTRTDDVGVKLPIYLIPSNKHVLDGGIALGWTKSAHFSAAVFVGKAFSFFDN